VQTRVAQTLHTRHDASMKVFLSWSKDRSRRLAEQLNDWLPLVLHPVDCWLSNADIENGASWDGKIKTELEKTGVGISCLTPENLEEPWLLFEAGAIAKTTDALLCPLLLGLRPLDLVPPLSTFQAAVATKSSILRLVETINGRVEKAGEKQVNQAVLMKLFDNSWPELEAVIKELESEGAPGPERPRRTDSEILEEVLETVRRIDRTQVNLPTSRDPVQAFLGRPTTVAEMASGRFEPPVGGRPPLGWPNPENDDDSSS
jgi:hypothetical protein